MLGLMDNRGCRELSRRIQYTFTILFFFFFFFFDGGGGGGGWGWFNLQAGSDYAYQTMRSPILIKIF